MLTKIGINGFGGRLHGFGLAGVSGAYGFLQDLRMAFHAFRQGTGGVRAAGGGRKQGAGRQDGGQQQASGKFYGVCVWGCHEC